MVNKFKAIKRERARLRNVQNPQQVDYRRMRKIRKVKTKYWKLKKRTVAAEAEVPREKADKKKEKKDKPKKEPELEVIDEELEEIYSIDEDELEDEELEDLDEE
ncbi:MAG: hypothetical protein BAJATHORv1_10471 [Candidatus Thorarchaeota archaeon]|nr:MAG: hypothetical protein BAJATHORv1_10471 [Candidatus Thorarchaeota archaeon]